MHFLLLKGMLPCVWAKFGKVTKFRKVSKRRYLSCDMMLGCSLELFY